MRGLLPAAVVAALAAEFERGSTSANGAYRLGTVSPATFAQVRPFIQALVDTVSRSGQLMPRRFGSGVFFAIENGIDFKWHQDHESFFLHQSHRDYLNIFIPVIKPVFEKTNLSLVPADRFWDVAPELWSRLEWGGAATATWDGRKTVISNDWCGGVHGEISCHLDSLAETPYLAAGDALILRGDLFHQTQDTDTNRVALSVRASNDAHIVTREHFEQTCETKNWFMQTNQPVYNRIREVFAERETLSVGELLERAYRG